VYRSQPRTQSLDEALAAPLATVVGYTWDDLVETPFRPADVLVLLHRDQCDDVPRPEGHPEADATWRHYANCTCAQLRRTLAGVGATLQRVGSVTVGTFNVQANEIDNEVVNRLDLTDLPALYLFHATDKSRPEQFYRRPAAGEGCVARSLRLATDY
jgi:hypothetical protein